MVVQRTEEKQTNGKKDTGNNLNAIQKIAKKNLEGKGILATEKRILPHGYPKNGINRDYRPNGVYC